MTFGIRRDSSTYSVGQPSADQLGKLPTQGVQRIIALRPATEDHEVDERVRAAAKGLEYFSPPIAGEADLNHANVRTLNQWHPDPAQRTTLIHCGSGTRIRALIALRAGVATGYQHESCARSRTSRWTDELRTYDWKHIRMGETSC